MTEGRETLVYLVRHGLPDATAVASLARGEAPLDPRWVAANADTVKRNLLAIPTIDSIWVGSADQMADTMRHCFSDGTSFSFTAELRTSSVYINGQKYGINENYAELERKWIRFRTDQCRDYRTTIAITSGMIMQAAFAEAKQFNPFGPTSFADWFRENGRIPDYGEIWKFRVHLVSRAMYTERTLEWVGVHTADEISRV